MPHTAGIIPSQAILTTSLLDNGIFANLVIVDAVHWDVDTLFWRTSYPLLQFMYPYWWKKREGGSYEHFFLDSLKMAGELFEWELLESGKFIKTPYEGYGKGITELCVLRNTERQAEWDMPAASDAVRILDRKGSLIGPALLQHLETQKEKTILLTIDFMSVEVTECIPRYTAGRLYWDYKTSRIGFNSPSDFLDHVAKKHFMSFLSAKLPESEVFNVLMNLLYWKPAVTSSEITRDLVRALYTELLVELAPHTGIGKDQKGNLIITGEVPAFLMDRPTTELMCVDGLGLRGIWGLYTDLHAITLPMLLRSSEGHLPLSLVLPSAQMWVIPHLERAQDIAKVKVGTKEYLATSGSIFRYHVDADTATVSSLFGKQRIALETALTNKIKHLVIDARKWPVTYGPHAANNASRIPVWLERLNVNLTEK